MALCDKAEQKGMKDWKVTFNTKFFRKGLNTTVRDGKDKYTEMNPGDTILMVDKFGTVIGNGRVLSTEVLNVNEWTHQLEYLLKFEHDPAARDIPGFCKTMDECYGGKKEWGPVVTVILFWID